MAVDAQSGTEAGNGARPSRPPVGASAWSDATRAVAAWRPHSERARSEPALPAAIRLETVLAELDGGFRARVWRSGEAIAAAPLLACLSAGDHLLMTDGVGAATRMFCDGMLARMGVETTYYPASIGARIAGLIRPATKVVYLESPGGASGALQDVEAIAAAADRAGVWTMMDNSWASPLGFKPLEHGVDIAVQALGPLIAGDADLPLSVVTSARVAEPTLRRAWAELGLGASEDEAAQALRGLRALSARLARRQDSALTVADWLARQPEVMTLRYPAWSKDPDHARWRRDYRAAGARLSVTLNPALATRSGMAALIDGLSVFLPSPRWGGCESRLFPSATGAARDATLSVSVGLEDPVDLLDDLTAGFGRMRAQAGRSAKR